jgi:hypothetical protein
VLKAFHPLAVALLNLRNLGVLALLLGMLVLASTSNGTRYVGGTEPPRSP